MTGNKLKLIACVAMLIDHIAWMFFPLGGVGDFMHLFGRITAPIMCYMLAEGYFHTHDLKKYVLRLGGFALLSQVPFMIFERNFGFYFNVMFSLLLGLLSLAVCKSGKNAILRITVIVIFCNLAAFYTDWGAFAVLWVLLFGLFHGEPKKQMIAFSIITVFAVLHYGQWFQLGLLLAIPLLLLYNGERGSQTAVSKWGFYIFYPAHLLVIGLLR